MTNAEHNINLPGGETRNADETRPGASGSTASQRRRTLFGGGTRDFPRHWVFRDSSFPTDPSSDPGS